MLFEIEVTVHMHLAIIILNIKLVDIKFVCREPPDSQESFQRRHIAFILTFAYAEVRLLFSLYQHRKAVKDPNCSPELAARGDVSRGRSISCKNDPQKPAVKPMRCQ